MLRLCAAKHGFDVLGWVLDVLDANDAAEQNVFFAVAMTRWNDSGAVNQVDPLHERDVLPDLGLAGDGCGGADAFLAEGVDDGGFASVGVADEANGDLLAVGVQDGELTEKGDQGAFAERVGERGVESEGWVGG